MATVKLASLAIRTAAKPVASWLKSQATQHESFRNFCINWAQRMHRMEARMRTGLINGQTGDIKPLNETRAIQNGANNLAEIFLFGVAATLILGETYRGSQKTARRRDGVDDKLDALREDVDGLLERWKEEKGGWERRAGEAEERNAELQRIISAVIDAGLRNGWLSNQVNVNADTGYDLQVGDDNSDIGSEGDIATSNSSSTSSGDQRKDGVAIGAVRRTLPVLTLEDWTNAIHERNNGAMAVVRSGIGTEEVANMEEKGEKGRDSALEARIAGNGTDNDI